MVEEVDSLGYLKARLDTVAARVASAVARRRAGDPTPDDPFRGLYIPESDVDRLLGPSRPAGPDPTGPEDARRLASLDGAADVAEQRGEEVRLRRLAREFGLDSVDVDVLLVALAPDLDPRFERLYGYLHDDVSRRRASIGLAFELVFPPARLGPERRRLGPAGRLVARALVLVEDADRPFLTRSLRVPDRVTAHLLGDDTPAPVVAGLMSDVVHAEVGDVGLLARALELEQGARLVYVRERPGTTGTSYAASALRRAGQAVVVVDLSRLGRDEDVSGLAAATAREARLRGGGVVAGPVEALADRGPAAAASFADAGCTIILTGSASWDPRWSRNVPLILDAPMPTVVQRRLLWQQALDGDGAGDLDPAISTLQFRLSPEQVAKAARSARLQAAVNGRAVEPSDLQAGARAQNAPGLERLARRIEPQVGWEDLVLPDPVLRQLRNLTSRARHRDRVFEEWGMGRGGSKGRGITALFAGESGTGKTISAEVVAGDLGLHLYVIDLATVVDKYIGETEKNLDRIFDEADRVNGVLLFDEADAIFGKRSEVKDAHDRYANVEVAYLLQRMERFDGLAVLTTNLRANVDEAFTRRLDLVVDFPMPDGQDRRRLWERHLRNGVPRAEDIDFDFLARAFKISGGNIRNIALGAAFLAAEAQRPVAMADLIGATEAEYRKLGHLCLESEFGPYFPLIGSAGR